MSERYHTVVVPVDIKNSLFFLLTISRVMLAACDEYDDAAMPQPESEGVSVSAQRGS